MSPYNILSLFIVYAFLGWCSEVAFAAANTGKFVNRGFLNGPLCPIYGFGVMLVLLILDPIKSNLLLLFIGSVLLCSVLEYLTGWVLEAVFEQRWWDYTDMPFNLGGYVCLLFSILWGLACVLIVRDIHPLIDGMVNLVPENVGWVIVVVVYIYLAVDVAVTVQKAYRLKLQLRRLNAIAEDIHRFSDRIGVRIADGTLDIKGNLDSSKARIDRAVEAIKEDLSKTQDDLELRRAAFDEKVEDIRKLIEERESVRSKIMTSNKRWLRAFPHLGSGKFRDEFDELRSRLSDRQMCNSVLNDNKGENDMNSVETLILDVRNPNEYAAGHVKGAKNIPVAVLEKHLDSISAWKDKPVVVYCKSGGRSARAVQILSANGFTNITDAPGVDRYPYDLVRD